MAGWTYNVHVHGVHLYIYSHINSNGSALCSSDTDRLITCNYNNANRKHVEVHVDSEV